MGNTGVHLDNSTDELTQAAFFMDFEHHEVHEGNHYCCVDWDTAVAALAPKYWHFITPNTTKRMHLNVKVVSSLPGFVQVLEAPTTSANGAPLAIINSDRNSKKTTVATFFKDPTVTTDGATIYAEVMGSDEIGAGGSATGASGGITERRNEFILKKNTKYFVKFTSENDSTRVSMCAQWYEKPYPE